MKLAYVVSGFDQVDEIDLDNLGTEEEIVRSEKDCVYILLTYRGGGVEYKAYLSRDDAEKEVNNRIKERDSVYVLFVKLYDVDALSFHGIYKTRQSAKTDFERLQKEYGYYSYHIKPVIPKE
jgi:hypothetical protein